MKSVINSTIAAKMNLHHESQLSKADSVANGIDRKLAGLWNQILAVLASKRGVMEKQFAIRNLLMQIVDQSASKLHTGLKTIASQSYKDAANVLSKNVPIGHLNLVASKKPVLEDKDAIRQQINDAVFDQLPPEKVDKIVRGTTAGMSWQGRLAQQTAKGSPDQLASVVTMGYLSGSTPASLAGKLKPFVQGISSTARRIARNESMRIAHESSMEAYEELGDMVVGYQIHATMDSRVRPHHAARSGNIYYKKPKPGQLSATKMPRPPLEEDGTVAHNCRCWITPVLEVQTHIEEDPAAKAVFTDNQDKLIPNPAVYTDWFANASDEDRRRVVGARRLKLIQNRLQPGEKLSWGHFVDPETGKLIDKDDLWGEPPTKQKERLEKFNDLMQKRKKLTQDVYTYGYEPPENSNLTISPAPIQPLNPSADLIKQPDIPVISPPSSGIEEQPLKNEKELLRNAFLKEEPTTIFAPTPEKPKLVNLSKQKTIPNMRLPDYMQYEKVSENSDLSKKLKTDGKQPDLAFVFTVKNTVNFINGMASMMLEIDEEFFDRYENQRYKKMLRNRAAEAIGNLTSSSEHLAKEIFEIDPSSKTKTLSGILKEEYAPEIYNSILNSNFVRTVKTAVKEKLKMKEENPQAFRKELLRICGGQKNYLLFMQQHSKSLVNSIDLNQQAALIMVQHDMVAAELEAGKVVDPQALKLFKPLAKKFYEQHLRKELPLAKISQSMEKLEEKLSNLKQPINVFNPKINRYEGVYEFPPWKRQQASEAFHKELFALLDNKKNPVDRPRFTFTNPLDDKKATLDLGYKKDFDFEKTLYRTERAIEKGMDWLSQLVGGNDLNVPVRYIDPDSKKFVKRAFATNEGIYLNPAEFEEHEDNRHFVGTVIHETGHYIEQDLEISKMVRGFLNYRIGMNQPIKFNERKELKDRGYDDSEKGVDDDFGKAFKNNAHYVGKIYAFGATEILSMGLEKLYKEPEEFIKKDPEYAAFVIKTVRYYRDKRKKGLA